MSAVTHWLMSPLNLPGWSYFPSEQDEGLARSPHRWRAESLWAHGLRFPVKRVVDLTGALVGYSVGIRCSAAHREPVRHGAHLCRNDAGVLSGHPSHGGHAGCRQLYGVAGRFALCW